MGHLIATMRLVADYTFGTVIVLAHLVVASRLHE
jgi:hypothetical protein